jgi:GIY-YIG catalytic domain-containing protein
MLQDRTMSSRPSSVVAERAVRYLHSHGKPASSVALAREVLSLSVADEEQATRVLGAAFADDPRLSYVNGAWRHEAPAPERSPGETAAPPLEPDVAFVLVVGARPQAHAPFTLTGVAASRRRGDEIVAACGGDLAALSPAVELKAQLRALIEGARIVLHAPPAGLGALESFLDEPLVDPLSLALLARRRLSRPALHTVEEISAALGLVVRVDDDPLGRIELLPACFDALREPGESWDATYAACHAGRAGPPWPRYAFSRDDLQALPPVPGTYRFYDLDSKLLYVGKSKNLKRRLAAWFGDEGPRGARGRAIVDAVHRFEVRPSGSDLEALLREASQIRTDQPERNVQRAVHARRGRAARLGSILILEPAEEPWVLRAWLIREGQLLDSVSLGPRGGGLRRIERVLRDEFFDPRDGPRSRRARPVDVEIVARWLSEHRDRAVAFDPTHLKTTDEVVSRLRWFLDRGALHDPEGSPILPR